MLRPSLPRPQELPSLAFLFPSPHFLYFPPPPRDPADCGIRRSFPINNRSAQVSSLPAIAHQQVWQPRSATTHRLPTSCPGESVFTAALKIQTPRDAFSSVPLSP